MGRQRRQDLRLALVQSLLYAPGSPDGWREFLGRLCRAVDGSCSNLISFSGGPRPHAVLVSAHTDPVAVAGYDQHWGRMDPWALAAGQRRLDAGTVTIGDELVPRPAMRRLPFFNDFAVNYDVTQVVLGLIENSETRQSAFSVNRGERQRRFDATEATLMTDLIPHVQRALEIDRRLGGAETMAADLADAVDKLRSAVLLVAANGTVSFANRHASDMLRARDGVSLEAGQLCAVTPALTTALRAAVARAVDLSNGDRFDVPGVLHLPRPSGKRPYSVLVGALPGDRASLERRPHLAVVFITDPQSVAAPHPAHLRTLFQLTAAEADLVVRLCQGLTIQQAAGSLGIGIGTARTRLKVIFQKTHTHRQSELIQLVMALSAQATE